MALDITGKTALVTGGASGIGREFVKKLVAGGCNVTIADLNPGPDDNGVGDTASIALPPGHIMFVQTDVTNWTELQNAFDKTIEQFGRLDIVCPGAGVFEPPSSNFWHFNTGTDTNASSSFKTLDINITHPIRATQLAIDAFKRQKLNHGAVVLISSISAQAAVLPAPMYAASKHAISGFVRSLANLEPRLNIRVNAVAPGCVKTPLWTADKLAWVDEDMDTWVTTEQVAQTMLDLVTKPENVGGTVLEVGVDEVRLVQELNDPGPKGRGHTVHNIAGGVTNVYGLIEQNFGV